MKGRNEIIKFIVYTSIFIPIIIFILEITFLFINKANNKIANGTKYDSLTGWRENCDNKKTNPNNYKFLICDGNGFITINPNSTSYITVEYPTNGEKVIQTRLFSTEGEFVVKSSNSRLFINNNSLPIRPDYVLNNIPGMNVGVYNSCQDGVHEKKVILVEGFDFSKINLFSFLGFFTCSKTSIV